MKRILFAVCLILANCATASSGRTSVTSPERANADPDTRSAARLERSERDLAELRARYEILESETRQLRERLRERDESRATAAVRIGSAARNDNGRCDVQEPTREDRRGDEAPVRLTLYGTPTRVTPAAERPDAPASSPVPFVIPPPPEGVPTTLAVVPLPGAQTAVAFANAPPPATPQPPATDRSADEYRRALELFRAGQLEEAARAFTRFETSHPTHAYATHAVYWRGEVRYAQRQYAIAASEFRSVVNRNPRGAKAADALLKIGLCHLRMGERERARATFEEVLRTYPNTEAARLASRESIS